MLEIIEHTLKDSIKLIPFLFITYLLMEFLEHKTSSKINKTIIAIQIIKGIYNNIGFKFMINSVLNVNTIIIKNVKIILKKYCIFL